MGRQRLEAEEGLWIRPCNGIHTFWMRFPIDVLFVNRELTVIKVIHSLRPFRVSVPVPKAESVIELPAGTAKAFSIEPGMRLRIER